MPNSIKNNEDARLLAALQKMFYQEIDDFEERTGLIVDYDELNSLENYEDHSRCAERNQSQQDCANKRCYFLYNTRETSAFGDIWSLQSDIQTIRGAYYNIWDDTDPDYPELFSYTTSEYSESCAKLAEVDRRYKQIAAQKGDK